MLNRTKLIAFLTEEEVAKGDHDKLFALRRGLYKQSLPALAISYEKKTGLSAYDDPKQPTSEEIDAMCEVPG